MKKRNILVSTTVRARWQCQRQSSWQLLFCVSLLLCLLVPASNATTAQPNNTDLTVVPAFEGNYVPGNLIPLHLRAQTTGEPFTAQVIATLPGSSNRYIMELPIDVADVSDEAANHRILYLPTDFDSTATTAIVQLEHDGTPLTEQTVVLQPRTSESVIGVVGPPEQVAELPQLPTGPAVVPVTTPLPDQPGGLGNLSTLLWLDPSITPNDHELVALQSWVANGGHLVLAPGVADGWLPPALRPAVVISGPVTTSETDWLGRQFATASPESLELSRLQPTLGSISFGPLRTNDNNASPAFWVERPYRAGQITYLALAPLDPVLQSWEGTPALFDHLLRPAPVIANTSPIRPVDLPRETLLTGALAHLPPVNLPPFTLIAALLIAYVVVAGPALLWWLRTRDQQVWGWLLLPIFGLGAAFVGLGLSVGLRADQRQVSQLTVVEQLDATTARVRTLTALYSPVPASATFDVPPDALIRPLREATGVYTQVQGISGDLTLGAPRITTESLAGGPYGIVAEQFVPLPALDAQLVATQSGWQAIVHNTTDLPIRDVVMIYGEQAVPLGTLQPGAAASGTWPLEQVAPPSSISPATLVFGAELAAARQPGSQPDRLLLMRAEMLDAMMLYGANQPRATGPLVFGWLERPPLPIEVLPPGAALQQATLLVVHPTLTGSGSVAFAPGWLRPDLTPANLQQCFGQLGIGITANTTPLTFTMRLPPAYGAIQPDELTLTLESENDWPNTRLQTQLFDWQAEQWDDIDYDGPGELEVDEPARYLNQGRLRLAFAGRIGETGCLFASAELTGELP